MSGPIQDVRFALRSLGRTPGFTVVALVTLALGIGGTSAIFSVVDGVLLRPLPFPAPDAIVSVTVASRAHPDGGAWSPADYLDYRRDSRGFAAFAGYREDIVDLAGPVEPVRLSALETTAAFFDVFGMPPLAGRVYGEASDPPGGPRVAVVSEGTWRDRLGGGADVVGASVRLNGVPTTIVGVMPAAFVHPAAADVWLLAPDAVPTPPIPIKGDAFGERQLSYFLGIARLRPGVDLAAANAELRGIADRLARDYPNSNTGESARAQPYAEALVGDVRRALLVLLAAVGFVLLIACANIAALVLARGAGRRRELAVRSALGAGRGRLIRELLTESVVLAAAGGALGVGVALWGIDLLLALAPETIPRLGDVRLDYRVAAFAAVTAAAAGIFVGLVPAWQAARANVVDTLKDGGRTGTSRMRTQQALVVGEVALALVLLIGAGLMLTSLARLHAVDPGFVAADLVAVDVPVPQARYDAAGQVRFYAELAERLRAHPVTARSALVFPKPFGGANASGGYTVEGAPPRNLAERPVADFASITPGYFTTMGIPLLKGRDVEPADAGDRPGVVVIDLAMAEREWPGEDPIGRRLALGTNPTPENMLTVVGVVGNARRLDLHTAAKPTVYVPHTRFTLPFMAVLVRGDSGEAAIADAVRQTVRGIDPELPIDGVATLDGLLERVTGQPRFRAVLVGAFAAAALLLAAVGLYGLISYTVAQRVPEIGVRLALGATPRDIGRLMLGRGLGLAALGVGVGLAAAAGLARLVEGLLFAVSASDPVVYAGLAGVLLVIAAAACAVPVLRAMRVDPLAALRME